MKKHLLLTLGLALTSPLLLAQTSGSDSDQQAQPATPAIPATPAPSSDSPTVEGPTTDDSGQTSGAAKAGKNSVGATGNPNTKQARTRARSSNANEFGSLDANHDGKVNQQELQASNELSGRFKEADANSDGNLSKAEFAKLQGGKPVPETPAAERPRSAGSSGDDTEGSDRTDKDDDVSRKLPGG